MMVYFFLQSPYSVSKMGAAVSFASSLFAVIHFFNQFNFLAMQRSSNDQ